MAQAKIILAILVTIIVGGSASWAVYSLYSRPTESTPALPVEIRQPEAERGAAPIPRPAVPPPSPQARQPVSDPRQPLLSNNVTVHFIDVGQGDAIFIDTSDKDTLIDAGRRGAGDIVATYLIRNSFTKIDFLVGSNPDADHVGGLVTVMTQFDARGYRIPVVLDSGFTKDTQTYKDYIALARMRNLTIVNRGMTIQLDSATKMTILNPVQPLQFSEANDNSIVILLEVGSINFWLAGDCEIACENSITRAGLVRDISILKVGHHGSRTSSSLTFLRQLDPEEAIISAGKDNQYGHPHQEVLGSLGQVGANVYRTDVNGNIQVKTNGYSYSVSVQAGLERPPQREVIPPPAPPQIAPPPPIPDLAVTASALPLTGVAPLSVSFSASVTGGVSPYSYSWNFGDGTSNTERNPTHRYNSAGTFTVTLTVTDSRGIRGSANPLTVAVQQPQAPPPPAPSPRVHVVINEVEANPAGQDAGFEWVELFNPGTERLDLTGWRLRTTHGETRTYTFTSGTVIPSGGRLVVQFSGQFIDNEDEQLILADGQGNEVDRTPLLNDTANDNRTWQRRTDGLDNDMVGDWIFKIATRNAPN